MNRSTSDDSCRLAARVLLSFLLTVYACRPTLRLHAIALFAAR